MKKKMRNRKEKTQNGGNKSKYIDNHNKFRFDEIASRY